MDNITKGLRVKADEISQIKKEIEGLNKDSEALKPSVKEFEAKRQKINELRKTLKGITKDYHTVLAFFKNCDEHYLDNTFPLFEGHQDENKRDWFGTKDEAGVRDNKTAGADANK